MQESPPLPRSLVAVGAIDLGGRSPYTARAESMIRKQPAGFPRNARQRGGKTCFSE